MVGVGDSVRYMQTSADELNKYCLKKVGKIEMADNGTLRFSITDDQYGEGRGITYAWVQADLGGVLKVLYVGKVGHRNTFGARCSQHIGGFVRKKGRGSTHAANLRSLLSDLSLKVEVWAKVAERRPILGIENVSLCDAEEEALRSRFQPTWNKL